MLQLFFECFGVWEFSSAKGERSRRGICCLSGSGSLKSSLGWLSGALDSSVGHGLVFASQNLHLHSS